MKPAMFLPATSLYDKARAFGLPPTVTYRVFDLYGRFRRAGVGGVVGHDARICLDMARAVDYAEHHGWEWRWTPDDDPDLSWMSDDERRRDHTVEGCILVDATGQHLNSLWGIVDADNGYRKIVEAELAVEAWSQAREDDEDAERAERDERCG